jgi:hypothetical protein
MCTSLVRALAVHTELKHVSHVVLHARPQVVHACVQALKDCIEALKDCIEAIRAAGSTRLCSGLYAVHAYKSSI